MQRPDFVVFWRDAPKWNIWNKAGMLVPVDELEGLGTRARNCLTNLGIRTVGDILTYSEAELLRSPNFGKTSLREIADSIGAALGPAQPVREEFEEDDFVRWCVRNRDRLEPLRSLPRD